MPRHRIDPIRSPSNVFLSQTLLGDESNPFIGKHKIRDYVTQAVEPPVAPGANNQAPSGFSGQSNLDNILSAVPQIEGLFGDIDTETAQFRGENRRLSGEARAAFQELNRSDAPTGVRKYLPAALMAIQALGNFSRNEFTQKLANRNVMDVFNLFEEAKTKKQEAKRQKFLDKFKSLEAQSTLAQRSQTAVTGATQIKGAATRAALTTARGAQPKGASAGDISDQVARSLLRQLPSASNPDGIAFEDMTTIMQSYIAEYNPIIYKELKSKETLAVYNEILTDATKIATSRADAYIKSLGDVPVDERDKQLTPGELDQERQRLIEKFTAEETVRVIESRPDLLSVAGLLEIAKKLAGEIEADDRQRQLDTAAPVDFLEDVTAAPYLPIIGSPGVWAPSRFHAAQLEEAEKKKQAEKVRIEREEAKIRRLRGGQ